MSRLAAIQAARSLWPTSRRLIHGRPVYDIASLHGGFVRGAFSGTWLRMWLRGSSLQVGDLVVASDHGGLRSCHPRLSLLIIARILFCWLPSDIWNLTNCCWVALHLGGGQAAFCDTGTCGFMSGSASSLPRATFGLLKQYASFHCSSFLSMHEGTLL